MEKRRDTYQAARSGAEKAACDVGINKPLHAEYTVWCGTIVDRTDIICSAANIFKMLCRDYSGYNSWLQYQRELSGSFEYFSINRTTCSLTSFGCEYDRKCWPPGIVISRAWGELTNILISSSAFLTLYTASDVPLVSSHISRALRSESDIDIGNTYMQPKYRTPYIPHPTMQSIPIPQINRRHPRPLPPLITFIIPPHLTPPEPLGLLVTALAKARPNQELDELVARFEIWGRLSARPGLDGRCTGCYAVPAAEGVCARGFVVH